MSQNVPVSNANGQTEDQANCQVAPAVRSAPAEV